MKRFVVAVGMLLLAVGSGACEPLGLGLPTTLELENAVSSGLDSARSFELTGSYRSLGAAWTVDLQLARPQQEHVVVTQGSTRLEAIVVGADAYFRSQDFLTQHLGMSSAARTVVGEAGSAWWKGSSADLPDLAEFTSGARVRAAFLGTAVTERVDHVTVDGRDAVEFSGPRADVYVDEASPHDLIRIHMRPNAIVDGIAAGDMHYAKFNADFGIATPKDVIDFSNLSTLPPEYTVVSVDTSLCAAPCKVSAVVKNLGGTQGAQARSSVTFTLSDPATGTSVGTCTAAIQPDVAYNSTTTVSCIIEVSGTFNAGLVTATPLNPGRA